MSPVPFSKTPTCQLPHVFLPAVSLQNLNKDLRNLFNILPVSNLLLKRLAG